jgi:hypothetical protein
MTNNKYVQDVRKIAKTDELLKRLTNNKLPTDKASIGMRRGVGTDDNVFDPCQLLYSNTDGAYTFTELVDGIEGPKIQDGEYNHCTQLNTITGMRETDSDPTLEMILKPDGVFLPADGSSVVYTSDLIMYDYDANPESYDPVTKWGFSTPQEAADKVQELFYAMQVFYNGTGVSGEATEPEIFEVTEEDIGITNYSVDYAVYSTTVSASGNTGDEETWQLTCGSVYDNTEDFPEPGFEELPFIYVSPETANTVTVSVSAPNNFGVGDWTYYRLTEAIEGCDFPFYYHPANTHTVIEQTYLIFSIPASYNPNLDPEEYETSPIVYGPTCNGGGEVFEAMVAYFPAEMPTFSSTSFQLAIEIGASNLWKPNPDESTAPLAYKNGVSIVTFEFDTDYTRQGKIIPGKDGGFVLFETSSDVPVGDAYIYRRDRTLSTVVPVAMMQPYLA